LSFGRFLSTISGCLQIESLKKRLEIFEAAASPEVMAKAINSFFAK